MSRSQKSLSAQLVAALDREIRSRPRGAIFAMERELEKSCGWWQGRVASERLSIQHLLEVLDHLGLDRVRFLREHIGRADGLELDRPRGPQPEIVRVARKRSERGEERTGVGEAYLATLEERRYEDPRAVVQVAEFAVQDVELSLLPRLLGILGSAHRLLLHVDEAEHYLYAAVELCHHHADDRTLGNLLRRYSYLLADRTDYSGALRLAGQGTLLLGRCGDLEGMGKGIVEQGLWMFRGKKYEAAVGALASSFLLLPDSCVRYRFAAYQTMGLAFREMNTVDEALRCLENARTEGEKLGVWAVSKTRWLRARVLEGLQLFEEAEAEFELLSQAFRVSHLGDAVLVTCELVRVRLRQGKSDQAFKAVQSMLPLLEPLRSHRVVSEAIAELAREGRSTLSIALLERVIARLESEQEHPVRWAVLRLAS